MAAPNIDHGTTRHPIQDADTCPDCRARRRRIADRRRTS